MHDIVMPDVAKSGGFLTIKRWLKQRGQAVGKGDIIAQVEAEKGLVELESSFAGVLVEILVQAGQPAKVGTMLAKLDNSKENSPQKTPRIKDEVGRMKDENSRIPADSSFNLHPSSSAAIPVLMPAAGNSMEEGTIVKWRVKEGDRITKGQVIFEVETDKATMEVEATDAGRVAKIVVGEGATQKVKEAVAYLSEGEVKTETAPQRTQSTQREEMAMPVSSSSVSSAVSISSEGRVKASPAARKLASEKGLDLTTIGMGSGPGGRILSTDLANVSSRAERPVAVAKDAAPAATANASKAIAPIGKITATEVVRKKMSKMRKAIAANLQASKQNIPHFYLRTTVNADAMMAFYKGEKAKYPCSLNDVVSLACAKAIIDFPALRSKLDKDEIVEYPCVNIGVAVGVEDGLTVPVLLNAHTMNLQQIAANTKRIVENARNGKLEGYGQGNFTITNLGMFGVEEFAAIVNPPEPAILAVGAAREAVIVKDGAIKAGRVMTMTLSCDHRLVDGLLAAKFMARVKELIENPTILI